ncbi:unnamed protein product [Colias eurytheme]|nr:unnamed protein product [Colias eurytheme]
MSSAVLRRGLSEGAVHRAGERLRVLQVVRVRVRVVRVVRVRAVRQVAVRHARRVAGAQVRRAAMVLRERQRRAGRPPVPSLLHLRPGGASRCATACAAPCARQRMTPRLVRAPVLALAARHPFRCPVPFTLASPTRTPPTAHRTIRPDTEFYAFVYA